MFWEIGIHIMKKYMKIILFLISTLFAISALAQEHPLVVRHLNRGVELHKKGDYSKAIEEYEKALRFDKKSGSVYYQLAYAYYSYKDYDKAVKAAKKLRKLGDKWHYDADLILARSYEESGAVTRSIAVYKEILKSRPDDFEALYGLSVCYLKEGKLNLAEEYSIRAVEVNAQSASAHLMFSNVSQASNLPASSILSAYFFLLIEPDSERAQVAIDMIKEEFRMVERSSTEPKRLDVRVDTAMNSVELLIPFIDFYVKTEKPSLSINERFSEINARLFEELSKKYNSQKRFVWAYYVGFFLQLKNVGLLETMSYYIMQKDNPKEIKEWLGKNEEKVSVLKALVKDYITAN